jgi:hypothetical protein
VAWGQLHHASGMAADLLTSGWLSRRAAADTLGITVAELDYLARKGRIRSRPIGPGARLYQVGP